MWKGARGERTVRLGVGDEAGLKVRGRRERASCLEKGRGWRMQYESGVYRVGGGESEGGQRDSAVKVSAATHSAFCARRYSCSCSSSLNSISAAPTSSSHTLEASLPFMARNSRVKTKEESVGA